MFTLSRAEAREFDRRTIEEFGMPSIVAMENAGRGCAELLMRLNPDRKATAILCGSGNNGGDGFVIARHLDNAGWPVFVVAFNAPATDDARTNFRIVRASALHSGPEDDGFIINPSDEILKSFMKSAKWIVDALFGTGLSRTLGDPFDRIVSAINASGLPILAADIPSGLNCDTGEPLGPTVRATHTATFVAHKRGFLNPNSKQWTGEVHTIDIGAPRRLVDEYKQRGERPA